MNRKGPYPQQSRRHSVRRQGGAAAVYFAITAGALLAAVGMSIDIGRLYNAQRELQRAANLAALDAARVTNGCLGHVDDASALSVAQAEVSGSLARNGISPAFLPAATGVVLGRLVRTDASGVPDPTGGVLRTFQAIGAADPGERTAVQVRLERPTPTRLFPLLPQGSLMVASSAADSRPMVSFGVGSGLASLSGGVANTLLNSLIDGSGLSLDAVSYQGLANANVRLGDLVAEAGVATVDDYLAGSTSLSSAFGDILAALGSGSAECGTGGCGAAASALTALAAATGGSRVVTPGDVLGTPTGLDGGGQDAMINVGELVSALAQSSNGTNAINLPLIANVPALGTGVNAQIVLIELPQLAIDVRAGDRDSYATTSQTQLSLTITAADLSIDVPGLVNARLNLNLPLKVRAGEATARLDEVQCARRGQSEHLVTLDSTTSVLEMGVGNFTQPIGAPGGGVTPVSVGSVTAQILLAQVPVANLSAGAYADIGSSQDNTEFQGPYPSPVQSVSTDLTDALTGMTADLTSSLAAASGLTATLTGAVSVPVGTVTAPVNSLLASVLPGIGISLEPVLALLGVSVGTADLQVVSLVPENNPTGLPASAGEDLSLQAFLFTH